MGLTRSAVRVLWLHLLEDVGWTRRRWEYWVRGYFDADLIQRGRWQPFAGDVPIVKHSR